MSAVGGQEIIILFVIIGILLFAFQKRPQAKKRDTLYAFEFSSNQPFEEISNRATLRNPLNLVFYRNDSEWTFLHDLTSYFRIIRIGW